MATDPKRQPPHDPSHPLTAQEKAVFGHDAKRHPVIGDLVLEQPLDPDGRLTPEYQALMYVENLARTDPEQAAMWREKLAMAAKASAKKK